MKLHLPKALFTAVMAVFAVASTTWAYDGPTEDADKNPETPETRIVYTAGEFPGAVNTLTGAQTLTATEDTVWDATGINASNLNFTINAAGYDVKLLAPTNANTKDIDLTNVTSTSLWLAQGAWKVDADADLSSAGTVYICGAQVQLIDARTLSNHIVLGTSTTITHTDYPSLNQSSLRVGHWNKQNKTSVLSGLVHIAEDTKIAFQASNHLNLSGTITGSAAIQLASYSGTNSLILSGDTSNFTGLISLATGNTGVQGGSVSLKLGNATVQTGGLSGAFAVGLDTVAASALTLKVAEGRDLTYSGALAAGISVVKSGAGTQTLTGTMAGGVTVKEGRLNLYGTAVNGITGLTLESGATLGIDKALTGSDTLSISLNGTLAFDDITKFDIKALYSSTARADGASDTIKSGYALSPQYLIASGVSVGENFAIEGHAHTFADGQVLVSKGGEGLDTTTFYINETAKWGDTGYTDNTATTYVVAAGKTFDVNWV